MRHRKSKYGLNRFTSWRRATLLSLVRNLIKYQRIQTTLIRAKAAQPLAEKVISLTKKNVLANKRRAFELLGNHTLVSLLFKELGPRYGKRSSGFTRIIKLGPRRGDNASMVIFELTEIIEKKKKVKLEKEKAAKPEVKTQDEAKVELVQEKPRPEAHPKTQTKVDERPPIVKKPSKSFLGGIRKIFKKERDSL